MPRLAKVDQLDRRTLVELLRLVVCPYCGMAVDQAELRDALLFGDPGDFGRVIEEWRTRAGNDNTCPS